MQDKSSLPTGWRGVLLALGIVFGDIGTSPLYALHALVRDKPISESLVLGGLSLIFWSLTLIVSVKYVLLVMRADNQGEGGIFAMYSLLRRHALWIVPLVIIDASMAFADSIFTPAISVSSAIEGLELHLPGIQTVPIVVIILIGLFLIQQFGTEWVGGLFGPIMLLWFLFIGGVGMWRLSEYPSVLQAIHPRYAIDLILSQPQGIWLLGAVFLTVTGVEALYADMGHVGRGSIRRAWIFVKIALLSSYFGQGAWMLRYRSGATLSETEKPFFAMLPEGWLFIGVGISTLATIIASQALITGAYTIFSEATRLGFWPRMRVLYPATTRSQMFVPFINWTLLAFVLLIVFTMRRSSAMEAAYGISINISLLITTLLLSTFFWFRQRYMRFTIPFLLLFFLPIELTFLYSNSHKIPEGGWIALALGSGISLTMIVWLQGERLKKRYNENDVRNLSNFVEQLKALSNEEKIPYFATQLICLSNVPHPDKIEHRLLHVILYRQPKRARTYWFVHIAASEKPYEVSARIYPYEEGQIYKVIFRVGFKLQPRLGALFRQVVNHLTQQKKLDLLSPYPNLRERSISGDFRFLVVRRLLNMDAKLNFYERITLQLYQWLDRFSLPPEVAFGIDIASLTKETVPLLPPYAPPELALQSIQTASPKEG